MLVSGQASHCVLPGVWAQMDYTWTTVVPTRNAGRLHPLRLQAFFESVEQWYPSSFSLLHSLRFLFRSRASPHLEVMALRHQLTVIHRSRPQRVRPRASQGTSTASDRVNIQSGGSALPARGRRSSPLNIKISTKDLSTQLHAKVVGGERAVRGRWWLNVRASLRVPLVALWVRC